MLLAIDIGNTDMVFGLHDGSQWTDMWRHPSAEYLTVYAFAEARFAERGLHPHAVRRLVFSSVAPGISPTVLAEMERITGRKALIVGPELYRRMDMGIDNPNEIGSDLVANAYAGYARAQGACVVVDFGTALTFTAVSGSGKILGVAIAPGLKTAMRALFFNTAQLPMVPLELPGSAIGKNTAHALQAGILLGYVGLVRELIGRIRGEMGEPARVIATGGLSSVLKPLHDAFDAVDPWLTLDGLRLLAEHYGERDADG
ncbi:MAG: type III pantothenate kinase [Bacteroidia bacterium]|nr:type III pantothenate kinase [Bacteroidia bacterium]